MMNRETGRTFATILMFALPALALTSRDCMTLIELLVVLSLGFIGKDRLRTLWHTHGQAAAPLVAAFALYFAVSLARMVAEHNGANTLDGPSRMLLALAAIAFVVAMRPSLRWFWLGVCWGAVGAGVVALHQWMLTGADRIEGYTHHAITFGDLSIAMGMMSLCALGEFRGSRLALLPLVALLSGLTASVLSGSRGGWIGLAFATLPMLRYGTAVHGKRLLAGVVIALALCVLAYFVPETSIARRLFDATTDVRQYFDGSTVNTHIGVRFELWKASWMMFVEHPWLGVGRDAFASSIHALAEQGHMQHSLALNYASAHNDMLHMLATGGLLDGALLLALYGAPLQFFRRVVRQPAHPRRAVALAGITLVVCYIGFGLTDVMFWLMLPRAFYAMMVCVLAGFCLLPEPAPN